jgi:hypothetical protein
MFLKIEPQHVMVWPGASHCFSTPKFNGLEPFFFKNGTNEKSNAKKKSS